MSDFYRALGDQTRRSILRLLKNGSLTQKEIVEAFTISQPAVKKHLNILLEEELINEQTDGKFRIYRLNQTSLNNAYNELLTTMGELLDSKLENLKNYVEKGDMENGKNSD